MKQWLLAIRPKTLGISLVPVLVGSSLAWTETSQFSWVTAVAALLGALLIQIGTNLHNDAADFERGADTEARMGPARATAEGWFTAAEVKQAAYLSFGTAFLIGIYLAWIGGWPIIALGLISLTAGYAYTGGPKPIAYSASGELFVFLFFGLAAVMGSYYIQTLTLSLNAFATACAVGFLAAAVLLVNNYRDLDTDRIARKLTLVFHLGWKRARILYGFLLLTPFLLPLIMNKETPSIWLPLVVLPWAVMLLQRFISTPAGPEFNQLLAHTAKLQLMFGMLLSLGLLI